MSNKTSYYQVNVRIQLSKNNITDIEEIEEVNVIFSEKSPIENRADAIGFFNDYIQSLLKRVNREYENFEVAEDVLRKFYSPQTTTRYYLPELELDFDNTDDKDKHIGVFLVINEEHESFSPEDPPYDIMIYGMPFNKAEILRNLEFEFEYFGKNNFDRGGLETVTQFNDEAGETLAVYEYLRTPYVWKGTELSKDDFLLPSDLY